MFLAFYNCEMKRTKKDRHCENDTPYNKVVGHLTTIGYVFVFLTGLFYECISGGLVCVHIACILGAFVKNKSSRNEVEHILHFRFQTTRGRGLAEPTGPDKD